MEITEVRVKLMEDDSGERLKAFCSITFDDCFVIRDLKIIEGSNGPFVAMPSRKLTAHCPQCGSKNHLRASYCNQCGRRLEDVAVVKDEDGRAKLYADIAHPINSSCREMIQLRVISEFQDELERFEQDGYVSRYEDPDDEVVDYFTSRRAVEAPHPTPPQKRTQFQPPQTEPRAPHSSNLSRQPSPESSPRSKAPGFGSGIFEE